MDEKFEVVVTSTFITKTKQQAEYIAKYLKDGESLMTCESSYTVVSEITTTTKV